MKKWIQGMVLGISLYFFFSLTSFAGEEYAQKLKDLGVFQGSDKGFELERQPTRIEGLVIMLRLLGEEENAKKYVIEQELFEDVPEWGKPYVYYAYAKGITKGVSSTTFAPDVTLKSHAFLTYTLRAMGYKDGVDDTADFIWDQPELFAMSKNLVNESQLANWSINPFLRQDVVRVAYKALQTKTNEGKLLAELLINKGVLDKEKVISVGITLPQKETQFEKGNNESTVTENSNIQRLNPIHESNVVKPDDSKSELGNLDEILQKPSSPSEKPEKIKPEFPDEKSYTLIGEATASKEQVYRWAKSKGMPQDGLDLIDLYFEICEPKGLNPVIQYAQMCHETGFLYIRGSLAGMDASYHNPCGLKVTEGGDGFVASSHKRFKNWREGIEAHTDHTALYVGVNGYPKADTPDPRHFKFLKGTATMLADLSGKWAPSWYYHRKIYKMLQEIEAIK